MRAAVTQAAKKDRGEGEGSQERRIKVGGEEGELTGGTVSEGGVEGSPSSTWAQAAEGMGISLVESSGAPSPAGALSCSAGPNIPFGASERG